MVGRHDEADEIEITEKMSRAGSAVLSNAFDQKDDWLLESIANEVYAAMKRVDTREA